MRQRMTVNILFCHVTYNSSVDISFRSKESTFICHALKTSGQYSVLYAKVALMQITFLLLTGLDVYNRKNRVIKFAV